MVERYGRDKGKKKLLGNHQKCWIWGRNLVLETLRSGRWPPVSLLLSTTLPESLVRESQELAAQADVDFQLVEPERIRTFCKTSEHQGFAAKMPEFPYATAEQVLDLVKANESTLVVLCDGLQDPYNFGAILRSADAFGVAAVVIPSTKQVGVTSLAARTSAGAVNHVPIARTDWLAGLAKQLQSMNSRVIGCSEKATDLISSQNLTDRVALVVGNEGTGISEELQAIVDQQVRIPLHGSVGSLNAAVAASVAMYEVSRQREGAGQ